jgi:hypothetical protein
VRPLWCHFHSFFFLQKNYWNEEENYKSKEKFKEGDPTPKELRSDWVINARFEVAQNLPAEDLTETPHNSGSLRGD